MNFRARIPDVTFLAAVTLVTFVQFHYQNIIWRFGIGARKAELLFYGLAKAILNSVEPTGRSMNFEDYRRLELLSDVLAISAFCLPALAVLLYGRIRSPRLTSLVLRLGAALYVAWLLVLSPKVVPALS
jgi:hypothetical protein